MHNFRVCDKVLGVLYGGGEELLSVYFYFVCVRSVHVAINYQTQFNQAFVRVRWTGAKVLRASYFLSKRVFV